MDSLEVLVSKDESYKSKRTPVIGIGFNMNCKKVLTASVLYFEDGRWLLLNGGIKILVDDLSSVYLDTKENRRKLRAIIKNS